MSTRPISRTIRKNFKWSSNLAYAVGLIATDGNLSSDKRHISLTSSDIQLLQTFKKCLLKTTPIARNHPGSFTKKPSYRFQISDVALYDWLLKIGLTPKKSLTLGSLDISKKYFPDFLRGHLDGDGSVMYYKDHYNTKINPKYIYDRLIVYFMSASKNHIHWLRTTIQDFIGISGSLQTKLPTKSSQGTNPVYVIKFSTKQAKVLLNWIYYKQSLPCLNRKYKIAEPFLNF